MPAIITSFHQKRFSFLCVMVTTGGIMVMVMVMVMGHGHGHGSWLWSWSWVMVMVTLPPGSPVTMTRGCDGQGVSWPGGVMAKGCHDQGVS